MNVGRRPNLRGPSLQRILRNRESERRHMLAYSSSYASRALTAKRRLLDVASYVHQPGVVVVTAVGEMDAASSPLVRHHFTAHLAGAPLRVIIDLGRVTFLDSSGISELIGAYRQGAARTIRVILVLPPGRALRALETAGVAELFEIHPTIGDALAGS